MSDTHCKIGPASNGSSEKFNKIENNLACLFTPQFNHKKIQFWGKLGQRMHILFKKIKI